MGKVLQDLRSGWQWGCHARAFHEGLRDLNRDEKDLIVFIDEELIGIGDYLVVRSDNKGAVQMTAGFTFGMKISLRVQTTKNYHLKHL